jgi:hypothetical protein
MPPEKTIGSVEVAALAASAFHQGLSETGYVEGRNEPDHRHRRLLRARRHWPHRRAAKQCHELAPFPLTMHQ